MDIRELARRSGVSVATVSRALNGRPDVSDRTRARVVAIAREIGYEPNQQARSLARRRSDLVGLVWDTGYVAAGARHPFLADVLIGLKIALDATDHHLMLISGATEGTRGDQAYVRTAGQYGLEGVVLMGVDEQSPAVAALLASGRPCVGIDLPLVGARTSYVTSDNRAGAASAVAHLYSLGHRRIATVTGPMHLLPSIERLAGYQHQCARSGLPDRREYVVHGDFFLTSGYVAMQQLLALPEPPTAVFLASDEMAVGALHAAMDAGLRVPHDVSVIGYDDVEAAALVRPALTTVAQDWLALAASAVGNLTQLMAATDAPGVAVDGAAGAAWRPQTVPPRLLPTHLVIRDSCGPVKVGL